MSEPSVAEGTVSQGLIDRLQYLFDEYGPAGTLAVAQEMVELLESDNENCGACRTCLDTTWERAGSQGIWPSAQRMIVCPTCGNKRCPKATYHVHGCTRSNKPGQSGSVYGSPGTRLYPAQEAAEQ